MPEQAESQQQQDLLSPNNNGISQHIKSTSRTTLRTNYMTQASSRIPEINIGSLGSEKEITPIKIPSKSYNGIPTLTSRT